MFTNAELTVFVTAVFGILGCWPEDFLADVCAYMDKNFDAEYSNNLLGRLKALPPGELAELAARCENFWKTPRDTTDTIRRLYEVGLIENFGVEHYM